MSNAQRLANDVATYYLDRLNPHESHSTNIRRHLRHPLLAVTRRILLAPPPPVPSSNDEEGASSSSITLGGLEGAEPFGETVDLNQFTAEERQMGLDWKEYLPSRRVVPRRDSKREGGDGPLTSVTSADESETEYHTETDASDTGGEGSPIKKESTRIPNPNSRTNSSSHKLKLDRRSVSRMEAFLSSCSMALPNDPLHHYPSKASSSNGSTKPNFGSSKKNVFSLQSLKNVVQDVQSSNAKVSSVVTALSNLTKPTASQDASSPSSVSTAATTSKTRSRSKSISEQMFPQIHVEDLTHRLTLYIKSIRRVHLHSSSSTTTTPADPPNHDHLCLLSHEPPRALQARIQLLLTSFASTTNTISSIRPILTNLLSYLTLELLSVEVLSEDLTSTIRNIVLEYEHLTSFASLAFLSSPQESTEEHLLPLLTKYVEYLVQDWKFCIQKCQLESQLNRCLDPAIRSMFKTMEFRSIGHLLEVCHEHR